MARAVEDNCSFESECQDLLPESYILPKTVKFGFHPVTGRNIVLSKHRHAASRVRPRQGLGGCIVYGERALKGTAEMEIEITKYDNSEPKISIRIGVMKVRYSTLLTQEDIPRYSEDGDDYCVLLDQDIFNNFSTDGSELDDIALDKHECRSRKNAEHLQESNIIVNYSPTSLKHLSVGDRVAIKEWGSHVSN